MYLLQALLWYCYCKTKSVLHRLLGLYLRQSLSADKLIFYQLVDSAQKLFGCIIMELQKAYIWLQKEGQKQTNGGYIITKAQILLGDQQL